MHESTPDPGLIRFFPIVTWSTRPKRTVLIFTTKETVTLSMDAVHIGRVNVPASIGCRWCIYSFIHSASVAYCFEWKMDADAVHSPHLSGCLKSGLYDTNTMNILKQVKEGRSYRSSLCIVLITLRRHRLLYIAHSG